MEYSYKFRVYPTAAQAQQIQRSLAVVGSSGITISRCGKTSMSKMERQ